MSSSNGTNTNGDKKAASESSSFDPDSVLNINLGVLGHVDSGKTSLVKALSTMLSTAALDKSKQSRQRGMTLDLGFSCFFLDEMPPQLIQTTSTSSSSSPSKSKLQITLVDCPGHASLIRTIIGGAQIIDMVLLVVDAFRGWQAQTTECLVLAELTSPNLVIALNKVDQFPPNEREARIQQAQQAVWERLKHTRFAKAPAVGVSACVGGERAAAEQSLTTNETYNVDTLIRVLKESLRPPVRQQFQSHSPTTSATNSSSSTTGGSTTAPQDVASSSSSSPQQSSSAPPPFYFSIDHCFPIRGRGTVLTGTVLNGRVDVNDIIEFPQLGLQRKVKSMQMFKRQVTAIRQGDRAGICVSNLDAKLIERGTAATPGKVRLLTGAIAVVRKIPYYHGALKSGSKFHVSVGHTTVMATVTFWGGTELLKQTEQQQVTDSAQKTNTVNGDKASASSQSYVGSSSLGGDAGLAGLPRIGFSFDQDFLQQDQLVESIDGHDNPLHWALLEFQVPVYCPMESLIIGSRLDITDATTGGSSSGDADSGNVTSCRLAFAGRLMESVNVEQGQANQIKLYNVKERRGVIARLGEPHKRQDDGKVVRYEVFGADLFKKETNMKVFVGMKVETEHSRDVGEIKSSYGTEGQFRVGFPAGTEAREGEALILRFKRYVHDTTKAMHQDLVLAPARPGTRIESQTKKNKKQPLPKGVKLNGEVEKLKGDVLENGKYPLAIISGFFTMEVNIKERAGTKVRIPSTNEEGSIVGPFGKAGKCKVSFPDGISAETGSKAELKL